jgi:esterase
MDLAFRELGGDGLPVVILHGLFGSSQNWAGMGRRLADRGRVCAVDLRNHGDSPHAVPHSLDACVEDLRAWADRRAAGPLCLVGHSMGGLVAMGFALRHPAATAGVAAIDVAPRAYPAGHQRELQALRTDLSACRTRADLDALLAPLVPDLRTRQFLLTNAVRDGDGFRWRIDAGVLASSTVSGDFAGMTGSFPGEALLIPCGKSPYVRTEDHEAMRRYFPAARIEPIPGADHWPNVTAPAELESLLRAFVARCNKAAPGPS